MIRSTADKSSVEWVARLSHAAGATGIFANPFLVTYHASQTGNPRMESSPVRPTTWSNRSPLRPA
jgi:hypothetical protein